MAAGWRLCIGGCVLRPCCTVYVCFYFEEAGQGQQGERLQAAASHSNILKTAVLRLLHTQEVDRTLPFTVVAPKCASCGVWAVQKLGSASLWLYAGPTSAVQQLVELLPCRLASSPAAFCRRASFNLHPA
jgi:hypothetical protein